MIIGTVAVTRSMVLAELAAAAFLLAFVGIFASFSVGIPTPGFLAVGIPVSRGHYFSSILSALALQFAVDWLFWFALMGTVYFPIARRGRRSKSPLA
jgi:hypothetical protein